MFTVTLHDYPDFVYAHSMAIKKYEFTDRRYTFLEIVYILHGALNLKLNQINYLAEEGMCLIIPPGTIADCCVDVNYGHHAHLSVGIRCKVAINEEHDDNPNSFAFAAHTCQRIDNTSQFIYVFEELIKAYNNNERGNMLSFYVQLCSMIHANNFIPIKKNNNVIYAKKIIDYIEIYYMSRITIPEIANYLSITPEYACNLFRAATNETIISYLNKKRISKAKNLIQNGGISMQYVASMTGYDSVSYFSRTFKKYEGISPSEFKRSLQRNFLSY